MYFLSYLVPLVKTGKDGMLRAVPGGPAGRLMGGTGSLWAVYVRKYSRKPNVRKGVAGSLC